MTEKSEGLGAAAPRPPVRWGQMFGGSTEYYGLIGEFEIRIGNNSHNKTAPVWSCGDEHPVRWWWSVRLVCERDPVVHVGHHGYLPNGDGHGCVSRAEAEWAAIAAIRRYVQALAAPLERIPASVEPAAAPLNEEVKP